MHELRFARHAEFGRPDEPKVFVRFNGVRNGPDRTDAGVCHFWRGRGCVLAANGLHDALVARVSAGRDREHAGQRDERGSRE